ncbi:hypothetical protein GOV07_00575 [Candidatus Woesearchaeota archaeon]|nr:hypothetical protein [Candidatus Woesearchaeota archaeon]
MEKTKPSFRKHDSHKRLKLSANWRKPRGRQSKVRLHKRGYQRGPAAGFGNAKAVFGLVKGLTPVRVSTPAEIEPLDAKKHGVIIASTVGGRKREAIITAAKAKNLTFLIDAEKQVAAVKAKLATKKKVKDARVAAKAKKKEKKTLDEKVKKDEEKKEEKSSEELKAEKIEEKKEQDKVLTQKQA